MSTRRQTRINATAFTISALLGLGALAGCSGGGSNSAPPAPTTSASQTGPAPAAKSAPALLHGALAALRSGGSVHVDITQTLPGGSVVDSDDATASGGRQIMSLGRVAHATILFIAGVGYVNADANGLVGFFDVPQPQAAQFAGRWIALRRGDKLGMSSYDDVTSGITLSSVATELEPTGTPKLAAPTTIAGQRVAAVQAPAQVSGLTSKATEMLYITDNSLLRPVLSEVVAGSSYKFGVSFSHWGEKLHLTAPANAIPASSVTPASSIA
jgi:hypothetical protein